MTDVYAHMLDQTLKQEWLATRERINAAGERVALTTPVVDDDAAWLKHQLARAKQTLPDGECGLPIQQSCPHPNACHSCPTSSPTSATGPCSKSSSSGPSTVSLTLSVPA